MVGLKDLDLVQCCATDACIMNVTAVIHFAKSDTELVRFRSNLTLQGVFAIKGTPQSIDLSPSFLTNFAVVRTKSHSRSHYSPSMLKMWPPLRCLLNSLNACLLQRIVPRRLVRTTVVSWSSLASRNDCTAGTHKMLIAARVVAVAVWLELCA